MNSYHYAFYDDFYITMRGHKIHTMRHGNMQVLIPLKMIYPNSYPMNKYDLCKICFPRRDKPINNII